MGIRKALARLLDPDGARREESLAYLTKALLDASRTRDGIRDVLRSLVRAVEHEYALGALSARLRQALTTAKGAIGDTIWASHDTLEGKKAAAEPPLACKKPYPAPAPRKTAADRVAKSWADRPSEPVEPTVAFFDEPPPPDRRN